MLMEAMRLSLLEHEEQQRKEAEERRKQAAAVGNVNEGDASNVSSSEPQASTVPGPSTLETPVAMQTSDSSTISSPQASTIPTSAPSTPRQSNEPSDTGQWESRSNSRSRTSPPHESNNGEVTPSWNHYASNPPPFGAINAALASVSTATAILGPPSHQSQEVCATDSPFRHVTPSPASDATTTPTIKVGHNRAQDPHHDLNHTGRMSTASPSNNNLEHDDEDEDEQPSLPSKHAINTDATTASLSSLNLGDGSGTDLNDVSSSYGHLPSSPDSDISNEPLLGGSSNRESGLGAESEHSGSPNNGRGVTPLPDDERSISMRSG